MPSEEDAIATITGIDPGSDKLGVGDISFNVRTMQIVQCDARTFTGSKIRGGDWLGEVFGPRYRRIDALSDSLRYHFFRTQPLIIANESPFIHMRRPQAYGALTEVVCSIREAVRDYDSWKPLYQVPPSSCKKAVGASGGADKFQVKKAMLQIAEITNVSLTPIEEMDEHSIDSLAVAYAMYLSLVRSEIEPLFI